MAKKQDFVELGMSCADVCQALERGLDGRQLDELGKSVLGAIERITTWVDLTTMWTLEGILTETLIQDCR